MLKAPHRKVSLVLMAIAIYYLYLAFQLPSFMNSIIDSDTLPKVLGVLLIVLSVILFFMPDTETPEQKEKRNIPKNDVFMLIGTFLMILVYIFFLEILGFILVSIIFIFLCSLFLGYKKHATNAIVAVLFPVTLYLIFTQLLGISLPSGILPI